jgi:pimeloyl-ACP methyl ester carboxylesterase
MPDRVLTEEPLQFGEGGRLFGILTLPSMPPRNAQELPVFVFLSAGLLHRVGPYRLHVRLVRELAQMGFSSLRVDLAGTGDSPPRPGLTNQQSVAADFEEILRVLESRLGRLPLVLAGLCTGADNAIILTLKEQRVVGMVLFDPFCFPDPGFRTRAVVARARAVVARYTNPARYIAWLKRRIKALTRPRGKTQEDQTPVDGLAFRELPTREQFRAAIESIREREGRVLSIFTQYALRYYNQTGQLGRVLGVNGYQQFCTELFWPQVEHTYRLELHRRRLIKEIKSWAGYYIGSRVSAKVDSRALLRPGRVMTPVRKTDSPTENRPI